MTFRARHGRVALLLPIAVVLAAALVNSPRADAVSAATTPCKTRDAQFVKAARQSRAISVRASAFGSANRSFEAEEYMLKAIGMLERAQQPCQAAMKQYRLYKLRVFEHKRQMYVASQQGNQSAADTAGNAASEWETRAAEAEMKWRGGYPPIEQLTRLWRAARSSQPSTG